MYENLSIFSTRNGDWKAKCFFVWDAHYFGQKPGCQGTVYGRVIFSFFALQSLCLRLRRSVRDQSVASADVWQPKLSMGRISLKKRQQMMFGDDGTWGQQGVCQYRATRISISLLERRVE